MLLFPQEEDVMKKTLWIGAATLLAAWLGSSTASATGVTNPIGCKSKAAIKAVYKYGVDHTKKFNEDIYLYEYGSPPGEGTKVGALAGLFSNEWPVYVGLGELRGYVGYFTRNKQSVRDYRQRRKLFQLGSLDVPYVKDPHVWIRDLHGNHGVEYRFSKNGYANFRVGVCLFSYPRKKEAGMKHSAPASFRGGRVDHVAAWPLKGAINGGKNVRIKDRQTLLYGQQNIAVIWIESDRYYGHPWISFQIVGKDE